MELKESFRVLRKRMWLISITVIMTCALVGIYSQFFVSPTYQASSKLLINHEARADGTAVLDLNSVNTNIRLMNSYKEIIQSEAILNKVASEHPEFGLTGKMLMGYISAASASDSQIMTVTARHGEYAQAAAMANAVAEAFKEEIPAIMNVNNVTILTVADPKATAYQVSPNTKLNVLMAFLLSSILVIGLSFLLEYLDDTIKSEADIEKILGLPTLSQVHSIRKDDLSPKSAEPMKPSQQKQTAGDPNYVTIKH
ncbi:YveK family protein [Cohnella faecalis]|uniref:Polysaccharide chain length determinant N-terminal domain-containing protein n=1 Tax=Cohnella faecalis TaxID=2315694 RepID=A0A398CMH9_9BACL|nr:Wzz/FepE/Etk N-terminal domain-containing protein [Cohnella faecalis]RIE03813.1 hypothetical protein D3H35_09680 [Cohnella faecalis]